MEPAIHRAVQPMTGKRLTAALAIAAVLLVGVGAPISITGQLLAYQDGYVFFTSGDGFRVSPSIVILDDKTHRATTKQPTSRDYARAVFSADGQVVELDLSSVPLPVAPLPEVVQQFAVTATKPYPNPELAPQTHGGLMSRNGVAQTFTGKPVLVTITVQVPPNTPPAAQVFITTDTSSWNPQEIQMDRIDALHYRITRHINSGTIWHYLYTRGSLLNEERAANGLDEEPRELVVGDADVRSKYDTVANWADALPGQAQQPQPGVIPTPYNPNPFPNLPPGYPTPHPR